MWEDDHLSHPVDLILFRYFYFISFSAHTRKHLNIFSWIPCEYIYIHSDGLSNGQTISVHLIKSFLHFLFLFLHQIKFRCLYKRHSVEMGNLIHLLTLCTCEKIISWWYKVHTQHFGASVVTSFSFSLSTYQNHQHSLTNLEALFLTRLLCHYEDDFVDDLFIFPDGK